LIKQSNRLGERPTKRRDRVVIDTGVLISAFAFGGTPEKAVKRALTEADIFVSPPLLKEYRDVPLVLEAIGKIDHNQLKALVSGIAAFVDRARIVQPNKSLFVEMRKIICLLSAVMLQKRSILLQEIRIFLR